MNTLFTDVDAAIEEAHFIQHELKKTAHILLDTDNQLHVVTNDQYMRPLWETFRVIETFRRGGWYED